MDHLCAPALELPQPQHIAAGMNTRFKMRLPVQPAHNMHIVAPSAADDFAHTHIYLAAPPAADPTQGTTTIAAPSAAAADPTQGTTTIAAPSAATTTTPRAAAAAARRARRYRPGCS